VSTRRLLKAAEAIREVVASSILTEMRDPRVRDVTVVGVKVTPDMREATVAVSVMGDETQQRLTLRGLQNAAGFLQSKIASRIDTRYTPRLTFKIDLGIQQSLAVGEILAQIQREKEEDEGSAEATESAEPTEPSETQANETQANETQAGETQASDEAKPE
jgi:ribosome-binding factor A